MKLGTAALSLLLAYALLAWAATDEVWGVLSFDSPKTLWDQAWEKRIKPLEEQWDQKSKEVDQRQENVGQQRAMAVVTDVQNLLDAGRDVTTFYVTINAA